MNKHRSPTPGSFDEWAHLAVTDREAFEAQRKRRIEQAIAQAPTRKRHRLRCLQWKLDQIRITSRTPMAACLRMNRLLWEAVVGESGLLASLGLCSSADTPPQIASLATARIVTLTRPRSPA